VIKLFLLFVRRVLDFGKHCSVCRHGTKMTKHRTPIGVR
jgi:hypothetical protein